MGDIRGKKTQTLFGEVEVIDEQEDGRGRNGELLARRNTLLLLRYAWYCGDRRNAYIWIVEMLSREFCLTASTVGQLIQASSQELQQIRNEGGIEKKLKEIYGEVGLRIIL